MNTKQLFLFAFLALMPINSIVHATGTLEIPSIAEVLDASQDALTKVAPVVTPKEIVNAATNAAIDIVAAKKIANDAINIASEFAAADAAREAASKSGFSIIGLIKKPFSSASSFISSTYKAITSPESQETFKETIKTSIKEALPYVSAVIIVGFVGYCAYCKLVRDRCRSYGKTSNQLMTALKQYRKRLQGHCNLCKTECNSCKSQIQSPQNQPHQDDLSGTLDDLEQEIMDYANQTGIKDIPDLAKTFIRIVKGEKSGKPGFILCAINEKLMSWGF